MRAACPILLLALVLLPAAARCQEPARAPCRQDDKACAASALKNHAVRTLQYWKAVIDQPLERRLGAAPPELIEFLTLDNIKDGFPNRPRAAQLRADFLDDARAAIREMPPAVRRLLSARLTGIYFVEDLGGTGYTETVSDARAKAVAGFVVLDTSVLERTANAWATWKENTPFRADPHFRLTAAIEDKRHDNRKNAIQYILLHEFGHVLSIGGKLHPSWNVEPKEVPRGADYAYFRLSWTVAPDNRYQSVFDQAFPQRKDVVYYLEPKLPADQMAATYRNLERTNFPTLYAATNPADDFAEAFASYVHTVLMKRPFEIRIYRDDKLVKVYGSCWAQQRCVAKRKILESLLN